MANSYADQPSPEIPLLDASEKDSIDILAFNASGFVRRPVDWVDPIISFGGFGTVNQVDEPMRS